MEMVVSHWQYLLPWALFLGMIYYWLVLPMNWVEDLSEVGFDEIIGNRKHGKLAYIRQVQQRKKIGNVPPVFPNGWYALIEADKLKPEQVKYVTALGENFAVFRTAGGVVSILDAYCPHMGVNMAIGGEVQNNCLECPFHGWKFNQDGKCVNISYTDKVPDGIKVRKWESREVNSFIFVWYHIENLQPTWEIEPVKEVASGNWVYRGRNEFTVNCHIQEIPENGCDIAHLDAIHSIGIFSGYKSLISPNGGFLKWLMSVVFRHNWNANWERDPKASHRALIDLTHGMNIFTKIPFINLDVKVQQIGPSYVELLLKHSMGNILIFQTVLPEGPLMQKVIHRVYCPWYASIIATIVLFGESIMFKRDMMVWNHKKYLEKPFLVKGDGKIMQYRNWYSQFYSPNSKKLTFRAEETLDW